MSFLNPLFLIALLTVGVPLLIYLLNLRKPRKVQFSTLAFFDSLKTTALKRIRIKRWLLLALRMLAITALVVALSRPFLPSGLGWGSEGDPKVVGIVIDNGPAMAQVDREGPYMDQALDLAAGVIGLLGNDDRVVLEVTHGEPLNLPLLSPGRALNELAGLELKNKGGYMDERLSRMTRRLQEAQEPNKMIYLVSDLRESAFSRLEERSGEPDDDVSLQILKVGEAVAANTGFDGVEAGPAASDSESPGEILVTVRNFGERIAENQFLNMLSGDELIAQQPLQLEPGEAEVFRFELPSGGSVIPVEFHIEGDELSFDNRYYAAVQLPESRDILVVEDDENRREFNSFLRPLLEVMGEDEERFSVAFTTLQQLQVQELAEVDAVILDGVRSVPDYLSEALIDRVQEGGGLLMLPAADGNMNSYNRLLDIGSAGRYSNVVGSYASFDVIDRMAAPEDGHPVLETIFDKADDEQVRVNIPELFYFYEISGTGEGVSLPILQTQTGHPLLTETRMGDGRIILSAMGSDPGWSNFPVKPLFAPLFYRIVEYLARGEGITLRNHYLGEPFRAIWPGAAESVEIETDGQRVIPDIRQSFRGTEIVYSAFEWKPGWAEIHAGDESALYSVNQHAMESNLRTLGLQNAEEILGRHFRYVRSVSSDTGREEVLAELERASFGREIWFWFIIAAILLLLTESLISRIYKAETIS